MKLRIHAFVGKDTTITVSRSLRSRASFAGDVFSRIFKIASVLRRSVTTGTTLYIRSNIPIGIPEAAAGYLRKGLQTERGLHGWQRIYMKNFTISTPFPALRFPISPLKNLFLRVYISGSFYRGSYTRLYRRRRRC